MVTKQLDEEAIFHAARRLENTEERTLFIKQACDGDAALAQRVHSLLEMYAADSEFHEPRPAMTVDYAPITEKPGTMIGPYKLKEQIGEGGFGLVFVAEQQEPVKRKVALKVIKPGMDTREVMARFTAERQALALMDHPNIARVLDAGATDSGRPYFVMELVRGIPITDYCDQNQLSPRDRLDLFITVCQAVQHAHQKGIIHRDIKPSNVLVTSHDGKPVAKVIDFGVAKAINQQLTERSIYTNFAQMVGTPLYMSPEQAEMSGLDIDTRSDIYSLGVLLYELLTGTTPLDKKRFAKAAYDEIRRMIREDEPQKPSTRLSTSESIASIAAQRHIEPAKLSKLMRGDLDWITMKALEKDRTRRYETANGLARDIQRYLSDEPVEACPPSTTYRLRKFARKNRAALMTAATIAFLLVGGIAVSTWQGLRARQMEAEAVMARDAAEANEQKAIASAAAEKSAKQSAEQSAAESKAVLEFVQDKILAAARPVDYPGGLGHDVKLRKAIEIALPFVASSFVDEPLIEAKLRTTLGRTFGHLDELKTAVEQFETARVLYTKHRGSDHPDTLRSMHSLATYYDIIGRKDEAIKLYEETLTRRKTKLGTYHIDTFSTMNNLALLYNDLGRHADALKLQLEMLTLAKAKPGLDVLDPLWRMSDVAFTYSYLGRHDDALKLREEQLTLLSAKFGPDHASTLLAMNYMALSYAALGRQVDAVELHEKTLTLMKTKLGADHATTQRAMNDLALYYARLGRHADAIKLYEEALSVRKAKLGADHRQTLGIMTNLALSYAALGRLPEALALHEETLKLLKAKLGANHPDTVNTIYDIACTHALMIAKVEDRGKQGDLAVDWLKQAVEAGFKNVEHMKKDTDLDPLREREDFKKLIAELEQKAEKK